MTKSLKALKAILSQDMQLFKIKSKSKNVKLLLPLFLLLVVGFSIGVYAYGLALPLKSVNLTYVMLSIFILLTSIILVIQGIYKSTSILFESRDNDLLFSLPIKKATIFFLRVTKFYIYQLIYSLLYILPAIVVYIILESPHIGFYFTTLILVILLPILPTLLSTILGYLIKGISSQSRYKKAIQGVLSSIIFFGILIASMNFQNILLRIVENASTINEAITKIYYPAGLYIKLITAFRLIDLILLIIINIVPFILVIYLGSIYYFKIISPSKDAGNRNKNKDTKFDFTKKGKISRLIKRDLIRYFTSTTYIMNTLLGLLIILGATIFISIYPEKLYSIVNSEGLGVDNQFIFQILPYIYVILIIFASLMTSITSSAISIEGKAFNVTKAMPISENKIILSKVLFGYIVSMPIILLSTLIFTIRFKFAFLVTAMLISLALICPLLSALIGITANLLMPKMNASSDIEVIKQSMSVLVSTLLGMLIPSIVGVILFNNISSPNINIILLAIILSILLLDVILSILLRVFGKRLYKKIQA